MKALATVAAAVLLLATQASADPAPEALFGRIPAVVDTTISPDGRHVAILGGKAGQRIVSIAAIDQEGLPTVKLGDLEAEDLRWVGDDHVLVRVSTYKRFQGRQGYSIDRYVSLDLQAQQVATLLERQPGSDYYLSQLLMGVLERPAQAVLLSGRFNGSSYTVFHVDPADGAGRATEDARRDAFNLAVDGAGTLRVQALRTWVDRKFNVIYRPRGGRVTEGG